MILKILGDNRYKSAFTAAAVLTLSLVVILGTMNTNYNSKMQLTNAQQVGSEIGTNPTQLTLPELFRKVEGSVVQVSTSTDGDNANGKSGLGSGFIYDRDGHIITNYHVVASAIVDTNRLVSINGDSEITVTFLDGSAYNARVVGSDQFSDLAVLKLEGDHIPYDKLVPLSIGDSIPLRVGEQVVAIGNPYGLSGSMTEGIISGLGRMIPSMPESPTIPDDMAPTGQSPSTYSIPDIIQTDAPINPGNSGGPLLNTRGEVIAINTAIFSTTGASAGVGFAIPSSTIKKVVPSLLATGTYQHPYIGIVGTAITPEIAGVLGLKEAKGFLVTEVADKSPAHEAGIRGGGDNLVRTLGGIEINREGDVILKVDDKSVRKIDDILTYLEREKNVGDTIQFTILRNGGTENIELTLGPRPVQPQVTEFRS
ncbi:MAG: S1C family serine protease [Nitrososphaeraceae archaeon]